MGRIRVDVDVTRRELSIETDEAFEQGLASPTNVSESALVGAVVSGLLTLASETITTRRLELVSLIVRNNSGRDFQSFQGRRFRDFVKHSLPEHAIILDSIDTASLCLGLGWKIRDRAEGPSIEGQTACTAFLNDLVMWLENELCSQIKVFNRRELIEAAFLATTKSRTDEQAIWRRTASSMLGLHVDQAAAMATITEHEFKINTTLHASRTLIELAVCECPVEGGKTPGSWTSAGC